MVSRAGWENAGDSDTVFHSVNSLYLGLGRLDEFLELSQSSADGGSIQPLLEYERGDSAPLNEYLDLAPTNFWTATLLAAAGRTDEARKVLESPESIQQTPRPPLRIKDSRNMAVGELALAEHRHEDAIAVLGESVPMIRFRSKLHYLYGAHSLARAYLAEGRIEDAIATLEQARLEKQWSIYEYAATYFWSRNQLYLIELYDQTGQSLKAEAIVDELRQLLVVADTNHPILIQLEKRSTSPKS